MLMDRDRDLPRLPPRDLLPADHDILRRIADHDGSLALVLYRPYGSVPATRADAVADARLWAYVPREAGSPSEMDLDSLVDRIAAGVRERLGENEGGIGRLLVHTDVGSPRIMVDHAHDRTQATGGPITFAGCLYAEHEDFPAHRRPAGIEQIPEVVLDALAEETASRTGRSVARTTIVRYYDPARSAPGRGARAPVGAEADDLDGYWMLVAIVDLRLVTLDAESGTWVRTDRGRRGDVSAAEVACFRIVLGDALGR